MNKTLLIKNITFIYFFNLILRYCKKIIIGICLITFIPLFFAPTWLMMKYILQFHAILWLGLILSYVFHEYLHIVFLRRVNNSGYININFSLIRISLYPKFKLSSSDMFIIALIPNLCLLVIGILVIIFAHLMQITFLMYVGYIYIFHIINIIPPLGDGMMIIKSILIRPERR